MKKNLNSILKQKTDVKCFTTPSHGGKFFIKHKFYQFYKNDISETDVYNPEAALVYSENWAAKIYGTVKTKYLINGSTSGVIASVLSCVERGEKVLIWNKAHPCHKNACILAGAEIEEYSIPLIDEWGIPQAVTVDILEPYLKSGGIKAVIITSPHYEGVVSDVKLLAALCHKYGAYFIVDEAHGALYPFSNSLPESAVKYADFTVQSLHKTAGGLNPTALLHTNTNFDVDKALSMFNTTSPSYPLLAVIESTIHYLNSRKGRAKIEKLIMQIRELRDGCTNVDFYNGDITKIVVKKQGLTGFELSEFLYKNKIEDERTNDKSVLLLTGLGTDYKKLEYLFKKLKRI